MELFWLSITVVYHNAALVKPKKLFFYFISIAAVTIPFMHQFLTNLS